MGTCRDQVGSMGHEEATSSADDRTKSSECAVVTPGTSETENPHIPDGMTLGRALRQVVIERRVRAEAHYDQQVGNGFIAKAEAVEHDRRLWGVFVTQSARRCRQFGER
ncbi:MAG: hypothetical protein WBA45_09905 [Microthrixaceae bacterium]